MQEIPQKIEHSAVSDLLGKPPGWLISSGISVVFLIVSLILLLSAYIHYPDKLMGAVSIENENAPLEISAKTARVLDTLLVEDGEEIRANQVLAIYKTDANWQEVLKLEQIVERDRLLIPGDVETFYHLGALQSAYVSWTEAVLTYEEYQLKDRMREELRAIEEEIGMNQGLLELLMSQLNLAKERIALESDAFKRYSELFLEEVISLQEFDERKIAWLAARQENENLNREVYQFRLRIQQLQEKKRSVLVADEEEKFTLEQSCRVTREGLFAALQNWKEQHLITAPGGGKIIFTTDLNPNEYLPAGTPLFSIVPSSVESTTLIAVVKVPVSGIGRIAVGNRVIIELDAYPKSEYGTLTAEVNKISLLPQIYNDDSSYYHVEAELKMPLMTSYGKRLKAGVIMTGTATIVTKDRSVLARIFEQLINIE
ncbi:MAG: HlyD family efflux transporter periplasmic adaptor subunit [Bacteroidota bacterium]